MITCAHAKLALNLSFPFWILSLQSCATKFRTESLITAHKPPHFSLRMSAYTTQKTNILGTRLNQVHSKVSWLQSPLHCSYLRISRHNSHTKPNSNHVHQRGKENIGARRVKGGGSPVDSDRDVGSAHKHGSGPLQIVIQVRWEAVLGCKRICMMGESGLEGY